jgi:small subunit ribosomal protein S11
MIKYKQKFKKKKKNLLILTNLHIKCTFKNTIISLTKNTGEVLKQWSTKSLKKGKFKKNTPYNVQLIIYKINKYIQLKKITKLNLYINGSGLGRFNFLRNLKKRKIKIRYIFDNTRFPFNGCREKKKKRL